MALQRMIDANALIDKQESLYMKGHILFHGVTACAIENAPTIDPETLPIVRQLRAELDKLRKEKRPAATLVKSPFGVCCSRCKTECSSQWVACPVCGAEMKKEDANDQS